jgi:uncharacterized protein YdhG (YjbR/CyaY superfamily)
VFIDFLEQQDDDVRAALAALIAQVNTVAPDAEEGRSYGMPAFRYRGKPLLGFAVHSRHLGLYPFSPEVLASVADRLEGFHHAKGSIRFSPDGPLPDDVIRDLVLRRKREIDRT